MYAGIFWPYPGCQYRDQTGEFNSDTPPAFIDNLALYFQSGTLVGVDIPSGQQLWSFAGNGDLTSAPVIVNQTIYIGGSSGTLYGLNTSGQQIWSTQVGAPIPPPDEFKAMCVGNENCSPVEINR